MSILKSDLDIANQKAKQLVSELRQLLPDVLVEDQDYYLVNSERYQIIVIDDDEQDSKEEPEFTSCLIYSFFNKFVNTAFDAAVIFVHYFGHERCKDFWDKCIIPRGVFDGREQEFFEDVYIQRLCYKIAPKMGQPYYELFSKLDNELPVANRNLHLLLNTLMYNDVSPELNINFRAIHYYLYQNDPQQQQTYDTFIRLCYGLMKNPIYKQMIKDYYL